MAQTLGSVAVGNVVKINESGSHVNYLVVHQGLPSSMYDTSCDGTWVLRQDIAENQAWDSENSNVLESSDIQSYLNGTWVNRYDTDIRNAIKQVKIPYRKNGGNGGTDQNGANGLSCKIFLLSGYEVGWTTSTSSYFPVDGAVLSYFQGTASTDSKRIAYLNGSPTRWWLRSPRTDYTNRVWGVSSSGVYDSWGAGISYGVRPAFVLSKNIYVEDDGTVVLYPSPSPITVPSVAMQGQPVPVSWATAPGADSYILQRKADGGEWTQVYAGNDLTYTDTAGSWTTVQYQVCGVFSGVNGAFAQSEVITVLPASALAVSGTDGDLGTITSDISYSVATDTGNPISLTLTVNRAQFFSGSVGTSYASSIPVMDLPTGTNTIVITATVQTSSDPVTVTRTWTYTKVAQTFQTSGGVASLSYGAQPIFPQTLAEAVKAIGGPWGGNLSSALNKLALAATYAATPIPKYSQVDLNLLTAHLGDIVNLPENGVMVPFYVGSVDYEPTLNTSGARVLLIRKDVYQMGQWNSSGVNTYANSTIDNWFNTTYKPMLDSKVLAEIGETTFQYTPGNGANTVTTLARAVFSLSFTELGRSNPNANAEGATLSISSILQNGNTNWTRTPVKSGNIMVWSSDGGTINSNQNTGYRPCFTLPTTFTATYYVDESGNVYPSQEYTTAGDFYDLWGNVIPTVKIATGSYKGTGTYGSSNANTLTFEFTPKFILILKTPIGSNLRFGYLFPQNGIFFTCQNGYSTTTPSANDSTSISTSGNSVSWYYSSAAGQLNENVLYYYVALG